MKRKNLPVLVLGTILVGLLIVRCTTPVTPVIWFVSPADPTTIVTEDNPEDVPIPLDVQVVFPPAVEPCAGLTLPANPATLQVRLAQVDDGVPGPGRIIDVSEWWNPEYNTITGQITIGEVPGESWAHYRIVVAIANAQGWGVAWADIRVEKPIGQFVGGPYEFELVSLVQRNPPRCLGVPQSVLDDVLKALNLPSFMVELPSGSDTYPQDILLPLPLIGDITVRASLNEEDNEIELVLLEPDPVSIDLGPYIPEELADFGLNCLVEGTADGEIHGQVSPDDADATIRVFDLSMGQGSGVGECKLTPAGGCTLIITIDGDLLS